MNVDRRGISNVVQNSPTLDCARRAETAGLGGPDFDKGRPVREAAKFLGPSPLGLKQSEAQHGGQVRMALAGH